MKPRWFIAWFLPLLLAWPWPAPAADQTKSLTETDVARIRVEAEGGRADAQNVLGLALLQGRGAPVDKAAGIAWIRRSAEQGNSAAQYNLGKLYWDGDGVPRDLVEAHAWFELARRQKPEDVKPAMDRLAAAMTPEQLAAARLRADRLAQPSAAPKRGSGTGFFITPAGHVLTCAHTVRGHERLVVRTADGNRPAELVAADWVNDVAVLKVAGSFAALPLAPSAGIRVADAVFTVGFPNVDIQGFAAKFTDGRINSLTGEKDDPRFFQISIPCQPGNSGGALVDARGNVVGLVSSGLRTAPMLAATGTAPQNVNYAVKSAYALALLESRPEILAQLRAPGTKDRGDLAAAAHAVEGATVLVIAE